MLVKCKKMLYNYLVEWYFKKRFASFVFPFEKSDEKIMRMGDAEKKEYYRQAKDLLENRVWKQESEEALREFYQQLAVKTLGLTDQQAHRLVCIFIKNFYKRVASLASLYQPVNTTNISQKFK